MSHHRRAPDHNVQPQKDTHIMAPATVLDQHELRIAIWPHEYVQYEGTRAQLEAEGLIPQGFEWPLATAEFRWEDDDDMKFLLRRARPQGMKGPRKLWVEGDWWRLRRMVANYRPTAEWRAYALIKQKTAELAEVVFHFSPLGQAACQRHIEAQDDQSFQSFKSLILGLVPLARGSEATRAATRPARQTGGVVGG